MSSLALAGGGGAIGITRPVTVVGRDAFGNTATGYSGTVHFTSSDAKAVLPADTALVNGTATVSVKFLTVGTQTLTASDVANPSLAGTMTSDEGNTTQIFDGTSTGDDIAFKAAIKSPMPLTLQFAARIAGDKITGTVNASGVGSWGFSGTRA